MNKQELRRMMRQEKREHSPAERAALSAALSDRVLATRAWQCAEVVLLYHPLPDEVDVGTLITQGYESGKRVLLPVCCGDELVLRCYEGTASLRQGSYGIMEPCGAVFPASRYGEIQLAVIPGMAFDAEGHRLGRGKGYYDRLLPRLSETRLVGLCFPFQMVSAVPCEAHDRKVHEVIS